MILKQSWSKILESSKKRFTSSLTAYKFADPDHPFVPLLAADYAGNFLRAQPGKRMWWVAVRNASLFTSQNTMIHCSLQAVGLQD